MAGHNAKANIINNYLINTNHLIRQRINDLLAGATKSPVITVCAGAGYGKTQAVFDFLKQQDKLFFWVQMSESDNTAVRLWENITGSINRVDTVMAEQCREIGFPDTADKMDKFAKFRNDTLINNPYIIVWDDIHFLKESSVLHFAETIINELLPNKKMILIGRDLPEVNIKTLDLKGHISSIRETDLFFTENELTDYFKKLNLTVDRHTIREILIDTKGWAFAINLITRSLERFPKYFGYIQNTYKKNIFELMEAESWISMSERLKRFLIRLSLIDHLSVELVEIMAEGEDGILFELKYANSYIRFDGYLGTYLIHHLFMDFLNTKQDMLTNEEKCITYKTAADWCSQNNFKIDALNYYEKIGDYESIVAIFFSLPIDIPYNIALFAKGIFDRAPAETFDRVKDFASTHINIVARLGNMREFYTLADYYERRFLTLPEDNEMRRHSLCGIYFILGLMRAAYAYDEIYDFDIYFAKLFDNLTEEIFKYAPSIDCPRGPWINLAYSSKKGSLQKYIETMIRCDETTARFSKGITVGSDLLIQGELLFYQGKAKAAEPFVVRAIENATERMSFETLHRALFYLMRIAVAEGNVNKAETALRNIENLLNEEKYYNRYLSYDISLGWFQYVLRQPEMFPEWLTKKISPYTHPSSIENFGNQIKARYYFLKKNYLPLLSYIRELKHRESFLYGRVEMLAMEACAYYKMKNNKELAWKSFRDAYETAAPNDIQMPFIELGKDMRSLIIAALREHSSDSAQCIGIPCSWLESIKYKATSYAKSQSVFINEHKKNSISDKELTPREKDVLTYLYKGFSQPEIANKLDLSVNTIKTITRILYDKLHVHKISDLVRIAAEQRFT
ncbi:MAG: LuxR C-terminal-related transcriptional regulator [Defluviitaleaceae bacterium]|nr:LuxR C-terminal-related transcriptional regulator [Defluviitaleaceae bacterium]